MGPGPGCRNGGNGPPLVGLRRGEPVGHGIHRSPFRGCTLGSFPWSLPLANLCTEWAVVLAFLGGAVSLVAGALFPPLGQALATVVAPAGGLLLLVLPHGQRLEPGGPAAGHRPLCRVGGLVYGVLILCLWRINRYPDRHLPWPCRWGACAVTLAAAVPSPSTRPSAMT